MQHELRKPRQRTSDFCFFRIFMVCLIFPDFSDFLIFQISGFLKFLAETQLPVRLRKSEASLAEAR